MDSGGGGAKRATMKTLQQRNDNIFAKLHCCHSETNLKVTKTILKKFPTTQPKWNKAQEARRNMGKGRREWADDSKILLTACCITIKDFPDLPARVSQAGDQRIAALSTGLRILHQLC